MKRIGKVGISLALVIALCSGCTFNPLMFGRPSNGSTSTSSGNGSGTSGWNPSGDGFSGNGNTSGNSGSNIDNVNDKVDYINSLIDDMFYFEADSAEEREEYVYKGLMNSLDDPYSVYYTADEYTDMMQTSSGSYEGIGVSIQQDPETKELTVIRVFQGSGAADAGIQPNDKIISVDGRELNGEDVSEVVKWIKGTPATTVNVTIYRPSTDTKMEFTVERRTIENSTVSYKMKEKNIGYIEVTDFYEATADQFSAAIDDLLAQGMTSLIVDLRNNPGGYVYIVVEMCNRIIDSGKIVYTMDKNGTLMENYEADANQSLDIPMVVLVNGNSASASEIFTGCMKDHGKATIIGTKTFGKGIVQQVVPLSDGSAVKLTIAKYFTPNGNDIHKVGIEPDIVVELPEELKSMSVYPEDQDVQLQKAIEVLSNK